MKKVSILIPAYNEEEVLYTLYDRLENVINKLNNYEFEVLLINDGSKDNTLNILRELRKRDKRMCYINLSRNYGKETAMIAGLDYVTGDCCIILDADLQDPPELIEEMLKYWEQGYDDVYAKRKSRAGESFMKKFTSSLFYKMLQKSTRIPIQKNTGDFRLVDRKVIDVINSLPEHNKFLRGLFSWVGFEQKAFLYDRPERKLGTTKYPFKKMFKLASDGILSFSTKPMKIVGGLGVIAILFSIAVLIYSLCSYFGQWNNLTPGWTSIMLCITFFAGVQLLSLWVLSEYISRIYDESKGRPEYIIKEKINID